MQKSWAQKSREKFLEPEKIDKSAQAFRDQQKSIVTINGSFDLLHVGHLDMLYKASCQGDLLIVALNTDESIRSYKSKDRPIQPLKVRMEMMAALSFVDYVTYFSEITPLSLLEKIRPDVHVNGAEYGHNCVEAEVVKKYGGRLHIVTLLPGFSTTKLLEKIKTCVS
jgi:D-glycero-beta-D-manno-heptose 1-phosphate adenylyltransferase